MYLVGHWMLYYYMNLYILETETKKKPSILNTSSSFSPQAW